MLKGFSQKTALERAQEHIDFIKKTSTLLQRRPNLPIDRPDDRAWEPDAVTVEAKRKAIENCEAAAEDYARAGHEEMAELYRLKAQSIGGSPSATRDYFRKLEEVRTCRKNAGRQGGAKLGVVGRGAHIGMGVFCGIFGFPFLIGSFVVISRMGVDAFLADVRNSSGVALLLPVMGIVMSWLSLRSFKIACTGRE